MNYTRKLFFHFILLITIFFGGGTKAIAQLSKTDSAIAAVKNDSLPFPLKDRRGDWFTWKNKNAFDLKDSTFINQKIEYDPKTNMYFITEKIGNQIFREPTSLTFEEFYALQNHLYEDDYFKERANAITLVNKKVRRPKHFVYTSLFDRIFGAGDSAFNSIKNPASGMANKLGSKFNKDSIAGNITKQLQQALRVDIKPQGSIDIMMGYQGQKTLNPTLPESARKNGGFDFNMNTNFNVNANIGNKLKLPISYNTLANFDYLNQLKLDYKGKDDEIIKSINAGNLSWQSRGTLIPSFQNLFGLKTQLQFGKLFITAAIAQQKSQTQTQALKGGAATTSFIKKLDDYDENRNFLLAQYFNQNFNSTMSKLPIVGSQVQIQRIEVWVTNKTSTTTNARYIAGFMDMGESNPYNPANSGGSVGNGMPDNGSNGLYSRLASGGLQSPLRSPSTVSNGLNQMNLNANTDYNITFARQLSPNEFYFNPQVGFISLNAQLQPDDVLAVAYEYSANGRVYKVGEFASDIALDTSKNGQGVQQVLFLKLLKATSARINLPIWQLMMKNVYSLDLTGVTSKDFKLNVFYNDPSGGLKIYLPESAPSVNGQSLLKVLNLDRLNARNDPQPDGLFDYIEGFTILSQQGKVVFPVLQPFGRDLESLAFSGSPQSLKNKYIYYPLYDSLKAIALTYTNLDHFQMQGQANATGGSEIYLGAFNIPQGSVKVNAGGQVLAEGTDYTVDYNLGSVKILNQAILNSGVPVNVSYENNGNIGVQQKTFFGLRADYNFNKKLSIGASLVNLKERPYYTKVDYGQDPIDNTMYGVDLAYKSELPGLTRFLGKLPFFSTKAKSYITSSIEGAYLKPGHPAQIGSGGSGLVYVDDFEGATSNLDLRFPLTSWALASTPVTNNPQRFPEAGLLDSIDYGFNRAKLAWYNIEPNLQDKNSSTNPLRNNLKALSDPRTRMVYTSELFPQVSTNITNTQTSTFDLAYYPQDLGPYNYEASPDQIDKNGKLLNPAKRWGGIMRALDQTDFITNNFEYIEFWTQDPFIKNPNSSGGQLYINLGEVSEDILKDGKRFYENGMNTPSLPAAVDSSSTWGKTPINPIQITQAFSNDPNDRPYQDVGFDGLDDVGEKIKRSDYLNRIAKNFGTSSPLYISANNDPSHDDYKWYRDGSFDTTNTDILGRYKDYNNPQGNSAIVSGSSTFSPAATLYPDNEDLNHDNTLNQTEQYFEYKVDLAPQKMVVGSNFITDQRSVPVTYADGTTGNENWYLFRVPIKSYTQNVGGIPDFQSIRFLRMYMTGFVDSTVMRLASFNLVRNQWRTYNNVLDTNGSFTPLDSISGSSNTTLNTLAVNVQENGSRYPINYVIPPGIQRVQQLSNNGINILQNEQAMSMQVYNLKDGDARADFKTVNLDLRNFGKLSMFAHAEAIGNETSLSNNDLNLVFRIGQDFTNNFYEIKIPLQVTPWKSTDPLAIWPTANNLDFNLQDLVTLKEKRNQTAGASISSIFREQIKGDPKTYSVLGNPNWAQVQGVMIGIENPKGGNISPLNAEVWVNELRLSNIDEKPSYAALARADIQMADLGKISVSASHYSQGWGTIEQNINQRAKDNLTQLNAAISIDAAKIMPKQLRLTLPVYASINKNIITPQYDPYDQDLLYKTKLANSKNKDSIRRASLDQTTVTTLNFTNVRVLPKGKPQLWSISNFDASYSYTRTSETSPTILFNDVTKHKVNIGYTYNNPTKYIEPFKKLIKNSSPWLNLVKDFNFNLKPSLLSVRTDINRQMGSFTPRIVNTDAVGTSIEKVDTSYDKYFTFDRIYNFRWDLTRSINADFSATNNAYVDEPNGAINTKSKKDSMWTNFFSGGRNTKYQQKSTLSYTVPFNKIPVLDWLTARYSYGTSYNWTAASLLAISLGNTIENSQDNNFSGEIDLTKFYNRSRWLKAANMISANRNVSNNGLNRKPNLPNNNLNLPQPNILGTIIRTREEVIVDNNGFLLTGSKKRDALSKWRKQKRDLRIAQELRRNGMPLQLNDFEKITGRLITMVKRVSINYTEGYASRIPGYMDSTRFLGQDWRTNQPGLDYVFGRQPDQTWLKNKATLGLLSMDSNFNNLFRQNFSQKLSLTAQLEPIRDLKIDLNLDKTFSKEFTTLFKDTLGGSNLQPLSPYASGGFNISYVAAYTMFRSTNPNVVSSTFLHFEAARQVISNRVAQTNLYWANSGKKMDGTYADGYGRYSQDVLIPAFLAAYTGKNPNTIPLINDNYKTIKTNPFAGILPMPNWRLTYNGLAKLPFLSPTFSQITITHGYTGNLSMNSFTSSLNYADTGRWGAPSFYDTISHNYVPFYLFPNVTIQENFGPLLGIDATTKSLINFKFEYKKSRTLSLSLVDYQLSETNSTEIVFGAGYEIKDFKLPFKIPGVDDGKKKVQSNLKFRVDVSKRDDATTNSQLDQANTYGTGGQKVITIQPSIDYVLNKRIDAKLFFDQRRVTPYISTSAPTISTRAGLQIKIGLGL